jgi:hypothetical protein
MAVSVVIDISDEQGGFEINQKSDGSQRVKATRVALVKGLGDGSADAGRTIFVRACEALQGQDKGRLGAAYDARFPTCVLTTYQAQGVQNNNDCAKIRLVYETPESPGGGGGGTSPFTARRGSREVPSTSQFAPVRDGKFDTTVLHLGWKDPKNPKNFIPKQVVTYTSPEVVQTISLEGIVTLDKRDELFAAVGGVNIAKFEKKDGGWWKYTDFDEDYVKGAKFSYVRITLESKKTEDWSVYAVLRDHNSGKFVRVNPNDLKKLKEKPYEPGIHFPDGDDMRGIVKICPYETEAFNHLFGKF